VNEIEERALKDISNATEEQKRAAAEVETLRGAFKAYRAMKGRELATLEARLRRCLNKQRTSARMGSGSDVEDSRDAAGPDKCPARRYVRLKPCRLMACVALKQ
jgi:NADH pyrophosphatase NudC (nudix superfamily)